MWINLKSRLFGWKQITSVNVLPKPSYGETKISTHYKSKNFEVKSVAQNLEIIPPKISLGGGESSANLQNRFKNNSNGERLNLSAGNLSSARKTGGQKVDYVETKKTGGELLSYKQQKTNS